LGLVTTEWLKRKREGVLVDHRQNGSGKTIASAYSVRAKPARRFRRRCTGMSCARASSRADFTMEVALERCARHGDLFAPVLEVPRPLAPAARALASLG
jgi:DNA primase